MKKYKIYPETTSCYFSTISITAWLPIFQGDHYFKIIIDSLKFCQSQKGLLIHGYVIMPTHVHLITSNKETHNLSEIMRDFKNYTSKEIKKKLTEDNRIQFLKIFSNAAENLQKQQYKIWQDGYHPVALLSEKWFNEKMEYMHYNPVQKGFVELPEHWKYSSARNWLKEDDRIIEIDRGFII